METQARLDLDPLGRAFLSGRWAGKKNTGYFVKAKAESFDPFPFARGNLIRTV